MASFEAECGCANPAGGFFQFKENGMTFKYGFCPTCGANGVERERRPNGNDRCSAGHTYPSSKAVPASPPAPDNTLALVERRKKLLQQAPEECPGCQASQLQLLDWIHAPVAIWQCRMCRLKFYFELIKD
jgi:ribosomal protein L37AE/L43A